MLLVAAAIAGCGFQLSRPAELPSYLETVRLEAEDTRSDVYLALEREFLARGIVVTDESPYRLSIRNVQTGQRILSVSARNIPREYEVFYTVSYEFRRAGQVLVDRPQLTLTRDYVWNELEVLGKAREERQIRELIVSDLVDVIVRQIAAAR